MRTINKILGLSALALIPLGALASVHYRDNLENRRIQEVLSNPQDRAYVERVLDQHKGFMSVAAKKIIEEYPELNKVNKDRLMYALEQLQNE